MYLKCSFAAPAEYITVKRKKNFKINNVYVWRTTEQKKMSM